MTQAVTCGLLGPGALVLGAVVRRRFQFPKRVLAAMLAFASGALLTALASELFEDAHEQGGLWRAGLGLMVGAVVFTFLSAWLDRVATDGHDDTHRASDKLDKQAAMDRQRAAAPSAEAAAGMALLAAVTLDGVPEYVDLGVSLGKAQVARRCLVPSSS